MKKARGTVEASVKIIADNQSQSGGWWYTLGSPGQHEGSTTVCAVQALVSAQNFGVAIDEKVLDKGFDYLKQSQAKDGGFNYRLGDGTSMKEGTAAAIATLGLMQKFDFEVMIKGYHFLQQIKPDRHQQGALSLLRPLLRLGMGMHLLYQEYKGDKQFETKNAGLYPGSPQRPARLATTGRITGPWKGWIVDGNQENQSYATAFALIAVQVPSSRLSIHNRVPPKLPKE